jgi:hypothetical protein
MSETKDQKPEKAAKQGGQVDAIVSLKMMTSDDRYGLLWCLLNTTTDLNYFAAIKIMDKIKKKLGDKKIDEYWQKFISG